ncbi:MAG: DNA gyrase subunit A [Candidatus Sungbacteria bacterium]|nr:DNA gyrase subunit A [Candidatus Sungbacteria bacterium]
MEIKRDISKEMRESFLDYAMSVIVARALPDARDGLKPVHRRILYSMHELGLAHQAKFRKSALVVGDVLGKYHPHGDIPVYEALVRMAQSFSLRYPLIHGQGNWGSIDGDNAAAMRYTECKMERITSELLRDIEKDTVNFTDNYDASRKEPVLLPAAVPQLLLNGSLGIAVGMATNIPPHNLGEVMAALRHLLFHPDATLRDLMKWIKGPDFPTGGIIFNADDIRQVYTTGRGSIVMRGEAEVTEDGIVISSLPYQVNKAELIIRMADLVHDKKIEGVRDIRDESDKEGLRIAIDVKQGAIAQNILNGLWRHTDLEKSFHVNMIALKDGIQPQTFTLKTLLEDFLAHRFTVVERRIRFDLARTEERIHILEGLTKALDHIEEVIATIKKSEDRPSAHAALMKRFALSNAQANAILEMRLATLAGLERKKVVDELNEKRALAKHLRALLEDKTKMRALIDEEFALIEKTYGDERRTRVVASAIHTIAPEDLVPQKEEVVILTQANYLKRLSPEEFRLQRRGGRGLMGKGLREEDRVWIFARANTHDDILFFTDKGKVYQTKMYEIPEGTRATKGKAAANVLTLATDEQITSIIALTKSQKAEDHTALVMATTHGIIKKTALALFKDVRASGIIAITLDKGDLLRWVRLVTSGDEIMLVTRDGKSIRFRESQARAMGRSAHGVRAIRLKTLPVRQAEKDEIVDCEIIPKSVRGQVVFTASEKGFGKKTNLKEYRSQARGGAGIKAMNCTAKTGKLVAAKVVGEAEQEFIAISERGQTIRASLKEIPVLGRATQGVRIMKLPEGDKLASIVVL